MRLAADISVSRVNMQITISTLSCCRALPHCAGRHKIDSQGFTRLINDHVILCDTIETVNILSDTVLTPTWILDPELGTAPN